jgi:hypothetical protein
MFSAPFLSTLLHRMRAVVRRVARPGAERARVLPAKGTGDTGHRSPVLRELARAWLSAQLAALTLLTMRIEAGETPDAAGHAPASASDDGSAACAAAVAALEEAAAERRYPLGFGWMRGIEPVVREDGAVFVAWLNEPGTKRRVLAAPRSMARLLDPILFAVGQRRPDWFPASGCEAVSPICSAVGSSGDLDLDTPGPCGGEAFCRTEDGSSPAAAPPPDPVPQGEGKTWLDPAFPSVRLCQSVRPRSRPSQKWDGGARGFRSPHSFRFVNGIRLRV